MLKAGDWYLMEACLDSAQGLHVKDSEQQYEAFLFSTKEAAEDAATALNGDVPEYRVVKLVSRRANPSDE